MATLISRYSGARRSPAATGSAGADLGRTRSFLPSLSYTGSSALGSAPRNFEELRPDYPVIDAGTGNLVSAKTGQSWTGPIPGQPAPSTVNPNDPNRYQAVEVIKSPAIAGATNTLMDSFKQGADITNKGWKDFFDEAKNAQAANREAFNREQRYFDVQPTADELRSGNERFASLSRDIGGRYGAVDANYEARMRELLAQAEGVLPQYDEAARAIANQQFAANAGMVSRYKAGSGTPMSLGSSEIAMLNRAARDAYLPFEREKIARRLGLITDLSMPLEREFATRDSARLADEYGREQYLSERNAETVKQIKQLELAVAGMSRQQAESYLRSLGLPSQIAQEILSRHIANLGGLAQLEEGSRYRGLQDTQGINLTPAVGYNMSMGSFPTIPPNRYRPNIDGEDDRGNGRTGDSNFSLPSYPSMSLEEDAVRRYANANPQSIVAPGVVDLPNDFTFGRSPEAQRRYRALQSSFE